MIAECAVCGVGASLGIERDQGTPSVEIGELRLAEHYGLTVAGRIGVSARIGGFFSVEIRLALDRDDRPMPGWTRVVVRKRRSSAFAFAADASAHLTSELKPLPASPHEFLGAVLGVNLRSWVALLDRVRAVTDLDHLLAECDELAVAFLAAWIDRQLDPRSLGTLVDAANGFIEKYGAIDVTVLTAFERHFDPVANPPDVTAPLETLSRLRSWADLEGEADPVLWDLANELTGGDALGGMAETPVREIQERASLLLALGNASLHPGLHAFAGFAKTRFSTEPLLAELRGIRTVDDLKAEAGKRLDGLVQRLLGDDINRLEATGLGQGLARLHAVLDRVDGFEKAAYARFTEAAKQAVLFDLHAEYSRASDSDALLDFAIDTSRAQGLDLLRAATHGDFTAALAAHQPDLVRINAGRLTHRLTRKRAVSINIVGWHAAWRYLGLERVILRTDQQLTSDDRGNLTVHTTVALTRGKDRKRSEERIATNFLLRFIGESRGILEPDPKNLEYLIDSLTRMTAKYDLSFADDRTTGAELAYYLGFARDFGLAASVQPETVAAMLPRAGPDDFGRLTVTYDVRYQSSGLLKLFTQPLEEAAIRHTMRKITLASYLRVGGNLGRLGWAYWTPATKRFFETSPAQSFAGMSPREFQVTSSPFAGVPAPPSVVLQGPQLETLRTICLIEDAFVRAILTLDALIRSGRRLSPRELEQRLGDVATALGLLDRFGESVNTVFAVFDALLQDVAGAERASSLKIQSEAAGITSEGFPDVDVSRPGS